MLNGRCLNWKTDFRRFFVFFDFSSFISSDDFFQQLIWFNFFRRVHMSAVVQWNSLLPYFDKSEGSNPRSFFTIFRQKVKVRILDPSRNIVCIFRLGSIIILLKYFRMFRWPIWSSGIGRKPYFCQVEGSIPPWCKNHFSAVFSNFRRFRV
jgi:hypothetical protein